MATIDIVHRAIAKPPPAVRVNGVEITRDAIAREAQHHPAPNAAEARTAAAHALAIRALLLHEARRLAVRATPKVDDEGRRETDEEAAIRALIDREVAIPEADEATCRRYFENNRRRFRSPELHALAHILIAADPADAEAREAARSKALALVALLRESEDENTFAEAARAVSACPSGQQGGALGQIGPGQTVPEFEAALGDMLEGAIHPAPVETRYGFHIVRMDRRIEGSDLPFDLVRERIAAHLADCAHRIAIRHYIRHLAGRAEIEGIDLGGSPDPLIQ